MANNEKILRLKEDERKLSDRHKRKGNSGEIMKGIKKKSSKKMHLWLETPEFMSSQNEKKKFNKMDKAKLSSNEKK